MSEQAGEKFGTEAEALHEVQASYSDDGVDLTLIRWMLSLTPEERLETLQNNIWSLMRLRDGVDKT